MLYYLVATLYVLTCFLLILVVLLQQGKGGDIANAFGGGASQAAFGARSGATVLSRATTVLAALFVVGAIVLGIMGQRGPGSVLGGQERSGRPGAVGDRRRRLRRQSRAPRRSRLRRLRRTGDPGPADTGSDEVATHDGKNHPPRGSGGIGRRTSLRGWR